MKILLYTTYRTGSLNFGEWLSHELSIKYYHEPLNKNNKYRAEYFKDFNLTELDSGIVKISPSDSFLYDDSFNIFDKNIVLYRENTLEQTESMVWAEDKNRFHFGENLSANYYIIPDDFLISNKEKIDNIKIHLDIQKEFLKSLKNCLHITYEEFYYSNIGIKKLEECSFDNENLQVNQIEEV